MFLGFEMFLVLGVPALLIKWSYYDGMPDLILVQKMVGGIDFSVLLAIPFFIFAAELMSEGRIAELLSRSTAACFRRPAGRSGLWRDRLVHGVRFGLRLGAGDGRGARPPDVPAAPRLGVQRRLQPGADRFGR